MEDPRIISALFIFLKMAYYNVLINICVTDGYQVYHTIEKEREDLRIAGCWVHARRKFDEALNVIPKAHQNKSDAFLVHNCTG